MPSLIGTGLGMHYKFVKTVNQSLKHKVNRCVLSLCSNKCQLSALQTAAGRLFHTTGPATEKALSPNVILVHETVLLVLDAERRRVHAGSLNMIDLIIGSRTASFRRPQLSVDVSVCLSATLMLNISETRQFTGSCPTGSL